MHQQDYTQIHGDAAIEKAQLGTSLQRTDPYVVLRLWGVLALLGVIAAFVISGGEVPPTWLMVLVQVIAGLVTLGVAITVQRNRRRKLAAERAVIREIDDAENARKMKAFEAQQGADDDT